MRRGELFIAEGAERESCRIDLPGSARPDEKRRKMTGVADFDIARSAGSSADKRGIMVGQRALTKDPAGALDELSERKPHRDERPEHGVEVGHQERSGDAFAGDIADDKMQVAALRDNDVAIVSADVARRLIMVRHFPAVEIEVGFGKQALLDLGGHLEVVFEGALLDGCQVIQAKPDQGVAEQPLRLDRLLADLAQSIRTGFDTGQSVVDLMEKVMDLTSVPGSHRHPLEPEATVEKLIAENGINYGGHFRVSRF